MSYRLPSNINNNPNVNQHHRPTVFLQQQPQQPSQVQQQVNQNQPMVVGQFVFFNEFLLLFN